MNDELHVPDFNLAETTAASQGTNEYLQTKTTTTIQGTSEYL